MAVEDPIESKVLHRARWVLPVAAPPIADGAILIAGPTIRAVGAHRDLAREHTGAALDEIDHGDAVLLPALVNAHTHLELSALAGRVPPGLGFVEWLEAVTTAAASLSDRETLPAIEAAIAECLATGTALVGEVTNTGRAVAPLARSGLFARVFHEVIAFDPRQAEAAFAAARARLTAAEAEGGTTLRHSLAPHAPYTASTRLLRLIRGFNGQDGRPSSIHLAESPAEDELFRDGTGPLAELKRRLGTTVDGWEAPEQPAVVYLMRLGWFDSPGLAVHVTQLTARGVEILRKAQITACLCPRSNRALGVGGAPARDLAGAGVPLALGTDSRASVDSLNLFEELAVAEADYGLAPEILIEAATRGGARALGFGAELGELTPGRPAAVIVVSAPAGVALADPYALLLDRPGPEVIHWLSQPGHHVSKDTIAAEARHG